MKHHSNKKLSILSLKWLLRNRYWMNQYYCARCYYNNQNETSGPYEWGFWRDVPPPPLNNTKFSISSSNKSRFYIRFTLSCAKFFCKQPFTPPSPYLILRAIPVWDDNRDKFWFVVNYCSSNVSIRLVFSTPRICFVFSCSRRPFNFDSYLESLFFIFSNITFG